MTLEVFMDWDQIKATWKQLKDKIARRGERLGSEDRNSVDLIGSGSSREGQRSDMQTTAFHPDALAKRSEFSLHIGC